jgi:hypothetical protein
MPIVSYTASNFAKPCEPELAGSHPLLVSWNELVWAAMTMGKPGIGFLFGHGWHSVSDLIVRQHMVYANLRQAHGQLEKSSLYGALDPTEKSGVSYFLGMMAARILGYRLLDVAWLFHVSLTGSLGITASFKGKSQPDLIGRRSDGSWVVVEAKGRTTGYSRAAMNSAKSQTRQLRKVNGLHPTMRVAVQAYFRPKMRWVLEDPDEFDPDARDVEFDEERALQRYYSGPMAAVSEGASIRQIGGREFLSRTISETGVTVAIIRDVRERLLAGTAAQFWNDISAEDATGQLSDEGYAIFPDGIAVALDQRWYNERMERDTG